MMTKTTYQVMAVTLLAYKRLIGHVLACHQYVPLIVETAKFLVMKNVMIQTQEQMTVVMLRVNLKLDGIALY